MPPGLWKDRGINGGQMGLCSVFLPRQVAFLKSTLRLGQVAAAYPGSLGCAFGLGLRQGH